MFKKSEEYAKIKKELETENLINEVAAFESFADNVFTFSFEKDNIMHEFDIICDDVILKDMSIGSLIELKRVSYFSHSIFLEQQKKADERIASVSWSMYENSGLN